MQLASGTMTEAVQIIEILKDRAQNGQMSNRRCRPGAPGILPQTSYLTTS